MGRIKTKLIKRVSKSLVARYGERFKENFEENKKVVAELTRIPSKKLRNNVTGYVTRLTQDREEL